MPLSKSKVAPACMFAALALPSFAQQSIELGKGAGGEALSYAMQSSSGTTHTVRIILTFPAPQTVADIKNVVESVSTETIDCTRLTHRVTGYELYTSLQPNAAPALNFDVSPANSKEIPVDPNAESGAAAVVRAVCRIPKPASAVASAPASQAAAATTQRALGTASAASAGAAAIRPAQPAPSSGNNAGTPAALPSANTARQAAQPASPIAPPLTTPAAPVSSASILVGRPFQDSVFTIGMLGKLAEYVYYDESKLAFDNAVLDKMSRGRQEVAADGRAHPVLDAVWNKLNSAAGDEQAGMAEKQAFLSDAQLVPVSLPKGAYASVKGFRAELYRHVPSGETVLVFRGTDSGSDWLTNFWLGVDYQSKDAPHYQAAYALVQALQKQNVKPLVVGHSLGAGMAQYVGYKFGLKVVGFNSSPLPARYFTSGATVSAQTVRLFSAVETDTNPATGRVELAPDPVSLDVPNIDAFLRQSFIHYSPIAANLHLVKPDCIQSSPVPLFTSGEQQIFASLIRKVMSSGVGSALMDDKNSKQLGEKMDRITDGSIRLAIEQELSKPVWQPDSGKTFDQNVANAVKNDILDEALSTYGDLGAAAKMAKGGYDAALGDDKASISGATTLLSMMAKAAATQYLVRHFLMPHSMNRFNRGMGQLGGVDVFQSLPEQVKAQCQTQSTLF